KFERQTAQFTQYQHDPDDPNSLGNNSVWAIYEDRMGLLWLGGFGAGLHKFERDAETFTQYSHDSTQPHSLSSNNVFSLQEDRTGRLWIGTWGGGLNTFERETGQFTRYQHDPADSGTLSHNQVTKIYEDGAGIFWIGTVGGLNRFEPETGRFTRYQHDPANPESLGHNSVYSIYEDSGGRLWIGMMGGGLDKFDREHERFIHYTVKDGLPSNTVFGILEDDDTEGGNLWLSTTWGLSRFNPQTETFRNYDVSDGLQGNSFLTINAYYKSQSGELFFGGSNGFNAFYPDQIRDNPHIPSVFITDFQLANTPVLIGGDSVLQQSILDTEHLTLSYLDRVLSFEFAALNYRASEKNRYRYTMEGFEEDWTEVDSTRRFATYTNLVPGEYVFRVIGSNNDGLW
ncbi:MAG: histidine kinase, partial [Desulfobulbaceae bacterium]|nr:histidine kinase [Desulfobulbaceae bacterium]